MPPLDFHPAVYEEINEAYIWYEEKSEHLGEELLAELEYAYLSIQTMPKAWPLAEHGLRKFIMKRFLFVCFTPHERIGFSLLP